MVIYAKDIDGISIALRSFHANIGPTIVTGKK